MDYRTLIKAAKPSELELLAKSLSAEPDSVRKAVIGTLLLDGEYLRLAEIYANIDIIVTPRSESVSRSFGLFLEECDRLGVTRDELVPMLIHSAYAPEHCELCKWKGETLVYLTSINDYAYLSEVLAKYDKGYKFYDALCKIDETRAINSLVNEALYGKNVNKTAIRAVLKNYKQAVSGLRGIYYLGDSKLREAVVRLFLLYRDDPDVEKFLTEVIAKDKSKAVRELVSSKAKPVDFEYMMKSGSRIRYDEFIDAIREEPHTSEAVQLFFVAFDAPPYIFVIENGKPHDLNNKPITIKPSLEVGVLHPIDLPQELNYLKAMEIEQPFKQINREIYYIDEFDMFACGTDRFNGLTVSVAEFNRRVKEFKLKNTGKAFVYELGGYAAIINYTIQNDLVSCGEVRYCTASSLIKLNKKVYTDSVMLASLADMPKKVYSEFMYCVSALFCG